jgi:hypothetical protein
MTVSRGSVDGVLLHFQIALVLSLLTFNAELIVAPKRILVKSARKRWGIFSSLLLHRCGERRPTRVTLEVAAALEKYLHNSGV